MVEMSVGRLVFVVVAFPSKHYDVAPLPLPRLLTYNEDESHRHTWLTAMLLQQ